MSSEPQSNAPLKHTVLGGSGFDVENFLYKGKGRSKKSGADFDPAAKRYGQKAAAIDVDAPPSPPVGEAAERGRVELLAADLKAKFGDLSRQLELVEARLAVGAVTSEEGRALAQMREEGKELSRTVEQDKYQVLGPRLAGAREQLATLQDRLRLARRNFDLRGTPEEIAARQKIDFDELHERLTSIAGNPRYWLKDSTPVIDEEALVIRRSLLAEWLSGTAEERARLWRLVPNKSQQQLTEKLLDATAVFDRWNRIQNYLEAQKQAEVAPVASTSAKRERKPRREAGVVEVAPIIDDKTERLIYAEFRADFKSLGATATVVDLEVLLARLTSAYPEEVSLPFGKTETWTTVQRAEKLKDDLRDAITEARDRESAIALKTEQDSSASELKRVEEDMQAADAARAAVLNAADKQPDFLNGVLSEALEDMRGYDSLPALLDEIESALAQGEVADIKPKFEAALLVLDREGDRLSKIRETKKNLPQLEKDRNQLMKLRMKHRSLLRQARLGLRKKHGVEGKETVPDWEQELMGFVDIAKAHIETGQANATSADFDVTACQEELGSAEASLQRASEVLETATAAKLDTVLSELEYEQALQSLRDLQAMVEIRVGKLKTVELVSAAEAEIMPLAEAPTDVGVLDVEIEDEDTEAAPIVESEKVPAKKKRKRVNKKRLAKVRQVNAAVEANQAKEESEAPMTIGDLLTHTKEVMVRVFDYVRNGWRNVEAAPDETTQIKAGFTAWWSDKMKTGTMTAAEATRLLGRSAAFAMVMAGAVRPESVEARIEPTSPATVEAAPSAETYTGPIPIGADVRKGDGLVAVLKRVMLAESNNYTFSDNDDVSKNIRAKQTAIKLADEAGLLKSELTVKAVGQLYFIPEQHGQTWELVIADASLHRLSPAELEAEGYVTGPRTAKK